MKRRNLALLASVVLAGCLPDIASKSSRGGDPRYDDTAGVSGGSTAPVDLLVPVGPAPDFGATTLQADPPPPLSGGTLAVAADGFTVVASDPDRDRIYVLDYRDASSVKTV